MIKATVNKGEVSCHLEGGGITIFLAELTVLANSVLDKIADEDKVAKDELVEVFCKGLIYIKDKEN